MVAPSRVIPDTSQLATASAIAFASNLMIKFFIPSILPPERQYHSPYTPWWNPDYPSPPSLSVKTKAQKDGEGEKVLTPKMTK
ncbi:hypothetical protein GCM10009804_00160 [Kribbella hippodromi]|uniref:Uncharacterized protein n=1 Tax=Kribbella hippodromi TaxID=434347 RepID=A0ABN2BUQ4_9ACTN